MGRWTAIWAASLFAVAVPIFAAATSPLLAWREPIYIAAGLAGVVALALMLFQPLLVGGFLPGLGGLRGRRVHRTIGGIMFAAVMIHVGALWITSPPDVVDALLFQSPTPFSIWGVIAMWAVFASAILAIRRKHIRPHVWRVAHSALAAIIVVGSILHALLIEGTMGAVSKVVLCMLVFAATAKTIVDLKFWAGRGKV